MMFDQALETYVAESRELLQQMEDLLLQWTPGGTDPEAVNAMFRAAHTIKGSAGLFGLDAIVGFTHGVESVLDRVRDGAMAIDAELSTLLLNCCDHMGQLVGVAAVGSDVDAACAERGTVLRHRLERYLEPAGIAATVPESAGVPAADGAGVGADYWHISLRFGRDVFRNGMDPLSFVRYLTTIGEIVALTTDIDAMPAAAEMDPESCYLGFDIGLRSSADKATIESVFEFVREDCTLALLPPSSKAAEYLALIKAMPEKEQRLGEMLVACGALTRAELEAGLRAQAAQEGAPRAADAPPQPLGEILVEREVVPEPVVQAALDKQKQVKESKALEARFIRLDAEKLDQLINRIGELVIAGAGISLAAKRVGGTELLEAVSTLANLVEDVRDSALQLRMVQIGSTFNRFQRVVHDVSRELGKDIVLAIDGAETELDKTMVERIGDPLMHLVRNAMDHGIEPTEARIAQGKPARGTVGLNAYHDAGSIVIEVSDDGGGLKRERILAKALERGLVGPDQTLADRDVWDLIFEPGFSTAAQISNLSGRGVGMDVVKRSIRDLRGSVDVESREGFGTTVRIRLPLTLAIIDGFLVRVGGAMFVIPLDMVEECVELTQAARAEGAGRNFVNLRGKVLPFVVLRELFDIEGDCRQRENILVVSYAGQRAGLVVDELMGEAQTVIKPLGKLFGAVKGIGGSTILGDGKVALILDIPGLLQFVRARSAVGEGLPAAAGSHS
jgi:two-component system, chemotaxis family, sensor kinase CheA